MLHTEQQDRIIKFCQQEKWVTKGGCLCTSIYCTSWKHRGSGGIAARIRDSDARWRWIMASQTCRLTPGKRASYWLGAWIGPRVGLGAVLEINVIWPGRKPDLEMQQCVSCFQSSVDFEPRASVKYKLNFFAGPFWSLGIIWRKLQPIRMQAVFMHSSTMRRGLNSFCQVTVVHFVIRGGHALWLNFCLYFFLFVCCMSRLPHPPQCNYTT
jgi:hypothetical protein